MYTNLDAPAAQVGTLVEKLAALGAECPALTEAHDTYRRRLSSLDAAIVAAGRDGADLLGALDSEDVLAHSGALRIATAQVVAERRDVFESAAAAELEAALRRCAPDVISLLRDLCGYEVERVRSAAPVLRGVSLEEPAAVLALGGSAAAAFVTVQEAEKRMSDVVFVLTMLESAGLYPRVGGRFTRASRYAGDLPADWLVLSRLGVTPQMTPAATILATGATLRLMTGPERIAWSDRVAKSYADLDLRDGAANDAAQAKATAFLAGAR